MLSASRIPRSALLASCLALVVASGLRAQPAEPVWPDESWPTSTPEEEGIDPEAVDALVRDIEDGAYGLVDAFMLIRHGKVVADHRFEHDYASIAAPYDTTNFQYNYDHPAWHPYLDDTELHTLQSVTKSVTSAAIGIAIGEGLIEGVDTPAYAFFEAYEPYPLDDRKRATTLEDFLTMRSGLQWNTAGGYDSEDHDTVRLENGDEWIRFVLEKPTVREPGTHYLYNDGVSVLLGKILGVAAGMRADRWAARHLFEPIGIDEYYWKITPDGEVDTEGGLYLKTEDLARIGYLFLRGGAWEDEQIVPRDWVETSTNPIVADVAPDDPDRDAGYGYQWWIPAGGPDGMFAANGYGGQFLFVDPEHDIVVVFNGWNIHDPPEKSTYRAYQDRILPHVHAE